LELNTPCGLQLVAISTNFIRNIVAYVPRDARASFFCERVANVMCGIHFQLIVWSTHAVKDINFEAVEHPSHTYFVPFQTPD